MIIAWAMGHSVMNNASIHKKFQPNCTIVARVTSKVFLKYAQLSMGLRLENYWVLYNYILPDLEFR